MFLSRAAVAAHIGNECQIGQNKTVLPPVRRAGGQNAGLGVVNSAAGRNNARFLVLAGKQCRRGVMQAGFQVDKIMAEKVFPEKVLLPDKSSQPLPAGRVAAIF